MRSPWARAPLVVLLLGFLLLCRLVDPASSGPVPRQEGAAGTGTSDPTRIAADSSYPVLPLPSPTPALTPVPTPSVPSDSSSDDETRTPGESAASPGPSPSADEEERGPLGEEKAVTPSAEGEETAPLPPPGARARGRQRRARATAPGSAEAVAAEAAFPPPPPPFFSPVTPAARSTLNRRLDPVVVPGAAWGSLVGEGLENLRLFALRDGALVAVPFQIDERGPTGPYVYSDGTRANPEESDGVLSGQDEVVFLASDAGDRVPDETWASTDPAPVKVAQATVTDPVDGSAGWVTLVSFAPDAAVPPVSPTSYVDQEMTDGNLVETPAYTVSFYDFAPPFHSLIVRSLQIPAADGGSGKNFVDRMMWRIDLSLFWGLYTYHFDEEHQNVRILAWKAGPVRALRRMEVRVRLPLGIDGPVMEVEGIFTPRVLTVPFVIRLPHNPGLFGTSSDLLIALDLGPGAKGMRFYRSGATQGWLVDGWMGREERGWVPVQKLDDWVLWAGPPGSLGMRSFWDPSWLKQVKLTPEYRDDLRTEMPPQGNPGLVGAMLFRNHIEDLEPGTYASRLEYYFPGGSKFRPETVEEILRVRDAPLEIRIADWQGKNPVDESRSP